MVSFRTPRRRSLYSPLLEMPRRGDCNGRRQRLFLFIYSYLFIYLLGARESCPGCSLSGAPILLCFHSPNDVSPEPQRNVSIAAVRGTVPEGLFKRIYMSSLISAASWLRVPYIACMWLGPGSACAIALFFWFACTERNNWSNGLRLSQIVFKNACF